MLLRIASDLHMVDGGINDVLPPTDEDKNSALCLAGDTALYPNIFDYLSILSGRFKRVLFVAGNHDYYGSSDLKDTSTKILNRCKDTNIYFLDDDHIRIEGTDFFGATLWSNITPEEEDIVSLVIRDFSRIKSGGRLLTVDGVRKLHTDTAKFFSASITEGSVVMTHHLPSFKSVHARYSGSRFNSAYATEMTEMIEERKPAIWIHGHTHTSWDYQIGSTRIICNPKGLLGENPEYNPIKFVEV